MFNIGFGEGIRFFIIHFVGAAKKQGRALSIKNALKKSVQHKKRKIIISTTSLVESFYNECLNFLQNEEV